MAETFRLKITNIIEWSVPSYAGYGYDDKRIYKFEDEGGKVYVWKTTNKFLVKTVPDESPKHEDVWTFGRRNDLVEIRASVKGESEYKGEKQTELTRCKLINVLEHAPTKEELQAAKKAEQLASLKGEDFIWVMPYKQYKEHYADCETVAGSFERRDYGRSYGGGAVISVIIREGRLKASGVRGKKFHSYEMTNELGQKTAYVAVCEDNAIRRAEKDFPEHKWECTKIYW